MTVRKTPLLHSPYQLVISFHFISGVELVPNFWQKLKNILKYNPNSSQAYLAHFSPVQPKQPLDMYEGARL